jgi:arylsulfatase A-like enzyme
MISRLLFTCWVSVLAAALPLCTANDPNSSARPNIIFILADDLGWTDLACQGSKYYETPHLDRLAASGMRFTSFYNCPNCAPSRAALMSGQYAPRTGVYTVGAGARGEEQRRRMVPVDNVTQLPLDKLTVAQVLQKAGYATALYGKWHLGEQGACHPSRRGFDEAIVSMGRHFNFATNPRVETPPGIYLADFLTDLLLRFIEKNQQRPFFLCLAHFAVHSPHQAKPDLVERFKPKPGVGGHRDPTYAAMIASVDASVGRILRQLDDLKLAARTVVIFSSDNGGVGGYVVPSGLLRKGITDNAPLRGGKGMLYEGGLRVPFIVSWPGVAEPGTVCDTPLANVDLFPTLAELANARAPTDYPLDGVSFAPLLRLPRRTALPRDAIFWHFPGYLESYIPELTWRTTPAGAARVGDFKLLEFFEDNRLELYNLKEDIGEQENLAMRLPEQTRQLHVRLAAWRKELKAPMPQRKPGAAANSPRNQTSVPERSTNLPDAL